MKPIKNKHSARQQVVSLLKEGVSRERLDTSTRIILDDKTNDFPQYLIKIVSTAPTASAFMDKLKSFVMGKGFVDGQNDKLKVNPESTFLDFHKKIAPDFAFFSRFAMLITPKAGGGIDKVRHIGAEFCRWAMPDENMEVKHVYYNPFMLTMDETKIDRSKAFYPIWELGEMKPERIREDIRNLEKQQIPYKGHIFFYNITDQRNRIYSRPKYFAGEDYIVLDQQVALFHTRNVKNNFFLGGILNIFGDPDQGIIDENGEQYSTVGEEFSKAMQESFSGAENAGAIMTNWINEKGQEAVMTPFPASQTHEMYIAIDDLIEKKLSIDFGIPIILLGRDTPGELGGNQKVRNAIAFTNEETEHYRSTLEQVYEDVFKEFKGFKIPAEGIKIKELQDFTDLPDTIFNSLTPKQKAKYLNENYGIEPDEEEMADPVEHQNEEGVDSDGMIQPITITPNGRDN